MEVYKINHICVNQLSTQFCLSYNKGLIIYDFKTGEKLSCSNTDEVQIGEVHLSAMFYELDLVAFTGGKNNQKYHNKKLVLWDNNKKKVVSFTQFKYEIINIKVIKKLIFVGTKEEINVCSFNEKFNYIEIIHKAAIDVKSNSCFEAWLLDKKYYIANVANKNNIEVSSIYENCLESENVKKFNCDGMDFIQNIFYIEQLNLLFIVDGNGSNIKAFSIGDFTKKYELYRGKNYAYISSIVALNENYIAVASSNKTLHIFDLNNNCCGETADSNSNSNSNSYFGMFYSLIVNPYKLNTSIMKIRLNEINTDEFDFFDSEFKKKGSFLIYNKEDKVLTCLCYNGFIYKLKMKFENGNVTYELKSKQNWCLSETLRSSIFVTEDVSLDLITINEIKMKEDNEDNWKII